VTFLAVYIKEAHPEDGWVLDENREHDIAVVDPTTAEERAGVARACAARLHLQMPTVVDDVDNAVASAYGGWPDRLYLIDAEGRIAYQGGEGPFGFKPEELAEAISDLLARDRRGSRPATLRGGDTPSA
jgi:hypothetical protein